MVDGEGDQHHLIIFGGERLFDLDHTMNRTQVEGSLWRHLHFEKSIRTREFIHPSFLIRDISHHNRNDQRELEAQIDGGGDH